MRRYRVFWWRSPNPFIRYRLSFFLQSAFVVSAFISAQLHSWIIFNLCTFNMCINKKKNAWQTGMSHFHLNKLIIFFLQQKTILHEKLFSLSNNEALFLEYFCSLWACCSDSVAEHSFYFCQASGRWHLHEVNTKEKLAKLWSFAGNAAVGSNENFCARQEKLVTIEGDIIHSLLFALNCHERDSSIMRNDATRYCFAKRCKCKTWNAKKNTCRRENEPTKSTECTARENSVHRTNKSKLIVFAFWMRWKNTT